MISPMRLAVVRHLDALVVDDAQLARGDQFDPLPCLDDRALLRRELFVLRPRLADGDEGRGLGQPVDLGHRPSPAPLRSAAMVAAAGGAPAVSDADAASRSLAQLVHGAFAMRSAPWAPRTAS